MKPISTLLVLSLAGVGAACSDPAPKAGAAPETAAVETAQVEGTLNLNIGRTQDSSGGLMVDANSADNSDGLMVGPGEAGGNFQDVSDLGVDVGSAQDLLTEPATSAGEDDLVRLPPPK